MPLHPQGKALGLMSIMDQTEHLHSQLNFGRTSTERLIFISPLGDAEHIPLFFNLYNHSNPSSVLEQQK